MKGLASHSLKYDRDTLYSQIHPHKYRKKKKKKTCFSKTIHIIQSGHLNTASQEINSGKYKSCGWFQPNLFQPDTKADEPRIYSTRDWVKSKILSQKIGNQAKMTLFKQMLGDRTSASQKAKKKKKAVERH